METPPPPPYSRAFPGDDMDPQLERYLRAVERAAEAELNLQQKVGTNAVELAAAIAAQAATMQSANAPVEQLALELAKLPFSQTQKKDDD